MGHEFSTSSETSDAIAAAARGDFTLIDELNRRKAGEVESAIGELDERAALYAENFSHIPGAAEAFLGIARVTKQHINNTNR